MVHNQRTSIKKDTPQNTVPTKDKIARPCPKLSSVHFYDPYGHIQHTENTHEDTQLIDKQ